MSIFLSLFLTFFKIGLFTFGGGYAMLPLIMQEVQAHGWMPQEELINFVAVAESTPGPFAINIATYIGSVKGGEISVLGGIFGSFCATLGVVLPSFIVILIVAKIYEKFKQSRYVKGAMNGLRPAAVGLIGSAVLTTALEVIFPAKDNASFLQVGSLVETLTSLAFWSSIVIFALSLFLILKKKLHPIVVILISAAIGIAVGYAPMLIK